MNLGLTADQEAIVDAVRRIVAPFAGGPREGAVSAAVHAHYSRELDAALEAGGFLDVARAEGAGPLESCLVVEQCATVPSVVEAAASAIVAPQLSRTAIPRPVALARIEDLDKPIRFLDVARTLLVDLGADVAVLALDAENVKRVDGIYAYPYGRLTSASAIANAPRLGSHAAPLLRRWWQVALAAEASAALRAAVALTANYVKDRRQFGRPIGSFQAIQHRLAACVQTAEAAVWLARKAAWSGTELDAAIAALYCQEAIPAICYDCHQFNGALGMTLEYPLHFWTFRLRALQGELGGRAAQSKAVFRSRWESSHRDASA